MKRDASNPRFPRPPIHRAKRAAAQVLGVALWAALCAAAWLSACADDGPTGPADGRTAALSVTPSAAGPVEVGDEVQLVADPRDADGRVAVGAAVSWTSSDSRVATVDADGVVTARGFGTAGITAESGGISATVQVSVASPDRATLEALYHATGGPSWTNSTGWLTDAPVDDWHGVTADSTGRVVGLHLQSNRLAGEIPTELGGLASLEQLYLQRNQLSGDIPTELGGLASLQWLLLNHNALTGAVPAELGDLASLQGLLINNNSDLAGALPLALSSLSALQLFRYQGTGLCVPADAAFRAWLNSIRTHSGTGVDCAGSSDATLSALSLSGVTLNPAFTSGTTAYTANVGNDVAQTTVAATASSDAASVSIVPSDADAATAGHQVDLAVGDNTITVSVTAEDGTRQQDYMVTVTRDAGGSNRPPVTAGTIPAQTLAPGGTATVDASTYFSDPDGDALAYSAASSNANVAGASVSGSMVTITAVAQGSATITVTARDPGGLTASQEARVTVSSGEPPTERDILEALYHATGGPSWTDGTGWLTDAPLSDWHGVTTDSDGSVVGLHLQSNRLAGAIPTELGGLASLEQLYLQRNQLSGDIPTELGGLASLQWLLLNHNALTGAVPAELGDLASLQGLLLNHNSELAGALPLALSSLSALQLFRYEGTGLCVPADAAFRAWLNAIRTHSGTGVDCTGSSDATLSALSLSGVTLNPAFASGTTAYTANVGNDVAQTTVAATASSDAASVSIVPADADAVTAGHQVALAVGSNTITVTVTAEDGSQQDYVVTVTRQAGGGSNRSPVTVGKVPARTLEPGATATVDASTYFSDPDGDSLSYSASSSDANVAGASVSGSTVTITAVAQGSATITVTARDPGGLTASQEARVTVSSGAPQTERDVLEALYQATGGPSWTNATGWLTDAPLGDWHGVTTDSVGSVVGLHLQGNRLAGEIPSELDGLASLKQLYLQRNQLSGSIPAELGDLASLQWLLLNDNALTGAVPAAFGRLDGLAGLLLNNNSELAGPLPLALSSLSALQLFRYEGTGLCVPADAAFRAWLNSIRTHSGTGVDCSGSSDASLSALSLSGVTLNPAFASGTTAYTANVGNDVAQTTVAATASSDAASVSIVPSDADATTAGHQVDLAVGDNTITVSVTAEDGTRQQDYMVTVTRDAGGSNRSPVTAGTIPAQTLAPGGTATVDASTYFSDPDGDALAYSAASSNANVAGASVSGSTVTITAVAQGSATITVTARDPGGLSAVVTFSVSVNASSDATLSALTLSDVTLHPAFASGTTAYTASVGNDVAQTTVAATASRDGASVSVVPADVDAATAGHQVALAVGDNTITASVTAEDGTRQNYTVTVTRQAGGSGNRSPVAVGTIPARTLNPGATATFDASRYFSDPDGDALAFSAASSNSNVARTAVSGSTVTTTAVAAGSATITVTARDAGGLSAVVTFGVSVNASSDATLSALSLSDVTLNPAFASGTTAYTASVGNDVAQTTVSATPRHSAATVAIRPADDDAATAGHQVDLDVGDNDITVTVTAEDGSQQDYVVAVTRDPAPSSDATLSALSLSDVTLNPAFASGTTAYTAGVGNDVAQTTVSATPRHSAATVAIRPADDDAATAGHQVDLDVGDNDITVRVRAEDGTEQTYSVTVTRNDTGFRISFAFASNVSAALEAAVREAGSYWMGVLAANEFDDVAVNDVLTCGLRGIRFEVSIGHVDDLAIAVGTYRGSPSDVLAAARICYTRTATGTPVLGAIVFDEADLNRGGLTALAIHEIAHVLGFGTGSDRWRALVRDSVPGNPGADLHFPGSRAVSAFDAAGGTSYTGGKVPLEHGDRAHWRESVLGSELMTPLLGGLNPLSAISIQALADIGYSVNAGLANPYTLTSVNAVAAEEMRTIDLTGDFYRGPVIEIDEEGNVVRIVPGADGGEHSPSRRPGDAAAAQAETSVRITIGNRR